MESVIRPSGPPRHGTEARRRGGADVTDLEGDGGEGRGHAAVERGGALGVEDATEEADRGRVWRVAAAGRVGRGEPDPGAGGGRLLQADAEGVERVARQHARHATHPAGHELAPAAGRQELRPELHGPAGAALVAVRACWRGGDHPGTRTSDGPGWIDSIDRPPRARTDGHGHGQGARR